MEFDRHGWVLHPPEPLSIGRSYTLLSPDPSSRVDIAFWAHKARTFFKTSIELGQAKAYPNGQGPASDAAWVDVVREHPKKSDKPTRLLLLTFPLDIAPALRQAGESGAAAIGGAGMDALVARAKRAWQIDNEVADGGDPNTPLLFAAILASILLAPIVPVGGGTIFGVKGARERLGLS